MTRIDPYFPPVLPVDGPGNRQHSARMKSDTTPGFRQALSEELSQTPVKLTKHAKERFIRRNIHLTQSEWQQIYSKMKEAKDKGVSDSLVLTEDAALVVNTSKNTVITALNREEAESHIFTHIDGTIVIKNESAGPHRGS